MAFGISFGGSKGESSSTQNFNQATNLTESQKQSATSQSQQTQQQSTTEKAVQEILQNTQQSQTQTSQQTGTTNVAGTSTGTGKQEQTAITNLLSGAAKGELENVVVNLLGKIGAGNEGVSKIVDLLTTRATGAENAINAQTADIIAGARTTGEKELQRLQTQLAQQAGGSFANTQVLAGTAEGRASLESQLAALQSQLGINARDVQTQELGQLLQAAGAEESQIAPLLNILKGAQQEQIGTVTTAQETQQQQQQTQDVTSTAETLAKVIAQTTGTTQTDSITNILSQATSQQQAELQRLLDEIKSGTATTNTKTKEAQAGFKAAFGG